MLNSTRETKYIISNNMFKIALFAILSNMALQKGLICGVHTKSKSNYYALCTNAKILIIFSINLIFMVPCIMLNGEINPKRCNNCVYSSQWLYSTCFG